MTLEHGGGRYTGRTVIRTRLRKGFLIFMISFKYLMYATSRHPYKSLDLGNTAMLKHFISDPNLLRRPVTPHNSFAFKSIQQIVD